MQKFKCFKSHLKLSTMELTEAIHKSWEWNAFFPTLESSTGKQKICKYWRRKYLNFTYKLKL